MRQPPLRVGEPPPACGQPERKGQEVRRAGDLVDQQQPAGPKQCGAVAQYGDDVGTGVQHVRGVDDVVRAGTKVLLGRLPFHVEDLERDAGVPAELAFAVSEEAGRHVRVAQLNRRAGTGLKDEPGTGAGAGADLQNPHRPALLARDPPGCGGDFVGKKAVVVVRTGVAAVEGLDRVR